MSEIELMNVALGWCENDKFEEIEILIVDEEYLWFKKKGTDSPHVVISNSELIQLLEILLGEEFIKQVSYFVE